MCTGIVERSLATYKRVMLYALVIAFVAIFCASYYFIGPFTQSPAYAWLSSQLIEFPILRDLVDLDPVLFDAFVRATFPMFGVWSVLLFINPCFRGDSEAFNRYAKVASLLVGGPSWFLFICGAAGLGIGAYAIVNYTVTLGFGIAAIAMIMFVFPGVFFRKYKALLVSDENVLLSKYSKWGGVLFGVLAIAGYFYGIFADPIRTVMAICSFSQCS